MKYRLEDWAIITTEQNPLLAPKLLAKCLTGKLYNHPKFDDGVNVTTSAFTAQTDGCVVTNSGSIYELGAINPEYEELYPNTRTRLFDTLPKA